MVGEVVGEVVEWSVTCAKANTGPSQPTKFYQFTSMDGGWKEGEVGGRKERWVEGR